MPPRTLAQQQRSDRASAAVACRVSRPVKSPQTPAVAPRRRKKSRASPATESPPAALAPWFPAPAPARAAAVDYSGLPCTCCGRDFGSRGAWFAVGEDVPRDWDLCVTCFSHLVCVCEHLKGAQRRASAHSRDALTRRCCAHSPCCTPALLTCTAHHRGARRGCLRRRERGACPGRQAVRHVHRWACQPEPHTVLLVALLGDSFRGRRRAVCAHGGILHRARQVVMPGGCCVRVESAAAGGVRCGFAGVTAQACALRDIPRTRRQLVACPADSHAAYCAMSVRRAHACCSIANTKSRCCALLSAACTGQR